MVLVGCDPVSFLEAAVAFRSVPIRVRASAVWFVDWSAQRLQQPVTAAAYRLVARVALGLADLAAAISPAAASELTHVGRRRHEVLVLANQPLDLGTGPAWVDRPQSVAYVGGLSEQQGVDVLLGAAAAVGREGVMVDIVGDGPARNAVARAVTNLPGVYFHSLVDGRDELAEVLLRARVGWALYDPQFPMHAFNDPLKIKDYLAAGMHVVSTLPTSVADGAIMTVECRVDAVAAATRRALVVPPFPDPLSHPLVVDAGQSLRAFLTAVDSVL
ncbi:MAG: glycosyltransferase [Actinomycetota bacterium]|nr:glycosyltransferase [Actinomycetota bacterium]